MKTRHDLKNLVNKPIEIIVKDEMFNLNIDANQELNYILKFVKPATKVNINIKENSQIKILILCYNKDNVGVDFNANLDRYANLSLVAGFLNDKSNVKAKIFLNEEGAEARVNSLIVSRENQEQTAYYEIINNAVYTTGNIDVIGITSDNGKVKVDGVGQINKGFYHSNNFQHLTGVMSGASVLEMNPLLLIDEHDVKAGHGATIGQINPEVLYYMMSRGITYETAHNLYIKGLISPFVDEIFDSTLCEAFNVHIWGEML